jgi:hypothetical protein
MFCFESVHRATQSVLTQDVFLEELERSEAMEAAVCVHLRKKSKGNIHAPDILGEVRACIDSYLLVRKQGSPEPIGASSIDFTSRPSWSRK